MSERAVKVKRCGIREHRPGFIHRGGTWAAAMAVVAGLGLAACPEAPDIETQQDLYERDVSGGIHDLSPVRGDSGVLRLHVDGDEYECSMCHEGFTGEQQSDTLKGEHASITFDHGSNDRCLNCHHHENSDAYIRYDGSEIPSTEPTELCRKCHGPHFREWHLGVHGRVNGAWGAQVARDRGLEQTKLDCIQCHDPHSPKFKPMKPERPPVHTRFDLGKAGVDPLAAAPGGHNSGDK